MVSEESAVGGIEAARSAAGGTPYGILVVDDEVAIRESLELTLGADYRVFTAANGEQGLAILEREDVALVIADQVMPGMNGVEFLEKVIERRPQTVRMMLSAQMGKAGPPMDGRDFHIGNMSRGILPATGPIDETRW